VAHNPEVSRRRFAVVGTQIVGIGVTVMLGVPIVGFLLNPLFRSREIAEIAVGSITGIPLGVPTKLEFQFVPQSAWPAAEPNYAVYVVRFGPSLTQTRVFSNVCSHMQCPVRWEPALNLFLCPCHGGLYNIEGVNIGGPPPKPLPQWVHRIDSSGILYVKNELNEQI
jgi:menaquinol-cytochrome c reductase iron-sulfur subunit